MNFNADGFNERTNFINNANDRNRLNKMGTSNIDSSVAKMRISENKPNIQTVNTDKVILKEEVRGNKENFLLRNNSMMNVNKKVDPNNPVRNALNKTHFNKF